jgi:hypothetical protein
MADATGQTGSGGKRIMDSSLGKHADGVLILPHLRVEPSQVVIGHAQASSGWAIIFGGRSLKKTRRESCARSDAPRCHLTHRKSGG